MSKLIDVDEAIVNFGFEWDDIPPTREEFVRFLKKQPIIDAVPVVRCKDCKHRYTDSWCAYVDDDDNFYCAIGERKEGYD